MMNEFIVGEVTAHNKGKSTIDIQLPNGDTFSDVVIINAVGTAEHEKGYVQVVVGTEVVLQKGYGSNWTVYGEISQNSSKKPLSISQTEYLLKPITDSIQAIHDAIEEISNTTTTNGGTLVNKPIIQAYLNGILKGKDDTTPKFP